MLCTEPNAVFLRIKCAKIAVVHEENINFLNPSEIFIFLTLYARKYI